jgi:hypothetical protein
LDENLQTSQPFSLRTVNFSLSICLFLLSLSLFHIYHTMQVLDGLNLQKPLLHIHPHNDPKGDKYRWPELVAKVGELLDMVGNDEFKAKVHSHRAMPSHRIARACISRKSQLPARTPRASDARA